MIKNDEAEPGDTVYLRPNTKAATRECYERLAAVLVDAKTLWPMIKVNVPDETQPEGVRSLMVHRMNVGLNPKVVKKEKGGDQVGSEDGVAIRKIPVMGKPEVNLDGQDVLF